MYELVNNYLSELSSKFYIYQVITIILLFVYGLIVVSVIRGEKVRIWDILLAYPLALVVYSLCGYFLLSTGITYNRVSILITMVLFAAAFFVLYRERLKDIGSILHNNLRNIGIILAVVILTASVCTSGIIPVSVTNDSMYFFSEYPRAIVNYGRLMSKFDHFVTDASPGIVILGTLPFLFGFDEIFGIQTFLDVNFIVIFTYASYEMICEIMPKADKKKQLVIAALSCAMLMTSMPFVLLSRWLMANLFFMEYMFIVLYLAYKYANCKESENSKENLIILSIFITGLSIMRMEGALTVGILLLCIMMLDYNSKDIAFYFIPPMFILQSIYLYRIFIAMEINASFQFMTKGKAVILLSFLVCLFVYAIFIRDRLPLIIKKYYSVIIIAGTAVINILIFIISSSRYVINIKAFVLNVIGNSGWGLMVPLIIALFILIPKKSIKVNFFDITVICYVLITIVTAWARGDDLGYSFGDSGNRVMMHIVPTLMFSIVIKITEAYNLIESKIEEK